MANERLSRIYIVGSVASEKTALAVELSERLGIPWYELDKFVWDRKEGGGVKRPPEQRDEMFDSILITAKWILEDVARPCFEPGLTRADLIVFLDTPVKRGWLRAAVRWLRKLFRGEGAKRAPTVREMKSSGGGLGDSEMNRTEFMKKLESCRAKVIVCRDRASFYQQFDADQR